MSSTKQLIVYQHDLDGFKVQLIEEEKSQATIDKYVLDVRRFLEYIELRGEDLSKENCIAYKEQLMERYKSTSVNTMIAGINHFLKYKGEFGLCLKPLRVQHRIFAEEGSLLSKQEYGRLVQTAFQKGYEKIALIMETICSTGIRVSELKDITAEAVRDGQTEVYNKGKIRTVFLPDKLRKALKTYMGKKQITEGPVFVTRNNKPVARGNIWTMMKRMARLSGISMKKVFPHNLRHLFARTFYETEKDIIKLADLLGHSNIETTRIYTKTTGWECKKILNNLDLLFL